MAIVTLWLSFSSPIKNQVFVLNCFSPASDFVTSNSVKQYVTFGFYFPIYIISNQNLSVCFSGSCYLHSHVSTKTWSIKLSYLDATFATALHFLCLLLVATVLDYLLSHTEIFYKCSWSHSIWLLPVWQVKYKVQ